MAIDIHCYIFFERLVYLKDGPFHKIYETLEINKKIIEYVEYIRKFDLIAFNVNHSEVYD